MIILAGIAMVDAAVLAMLLLWTLTRWARTDAELERVRVQANHHRTRANRARARHASAEAELDLTRQACEHLRWRVACLEAALREAAAHAALSPDTLDLLPTQRPLTPADLAELRADLDRIDGGIPGEWGAL